MTQWRTLYSYPCFGRIFLVMPLISKLYGLSHMIIPGNYVSCGVILDPIIMVDDAENVQ